MLLIESRGNQKLFESLVELIAVRFPDWALGKIEMDQPEWSIMGDRFSNKNSNGK
jgi:hypothetical protein